MTQQDGAGPGNPWSVNPQSGADQPDTVAQPGYASAGTYPDQQWPLQPASAFEEPTFDPNPPPPPPPPPAPSSDSGLTAAIAPQRGQALGWISLSLVLGATGFSLFGAWQFAHILSQTSALLGPEFTGSVNLGPAVTPAFQILVSAGIVGFIGWVLAIVATTTKLGRRQGIIGIVLGVLTPLAVGGYLWFSIAGLFNRFSH
jgi:hypothetical protein